MTQLINEREAATLLRLSVKCLQNWRVRGGGPPFIRLGRLIRYEVSALEAFVRARTRTRGVGALSAAGKTPLNSLARLHCADTAESTLRRRPAPC